MPKNASAIAQALFAKFLAQELDVEHLERMVNFQDDFLGFANEWTHLMSTLEAFFRTLEAIFGTLVATPGTLDGRRRRQGRHLRRRLRRQRRPRLRQRGRHGLSGDLGRTPQPWRGP